MDVKSSLLMMNMQVDRAAALCREARAHSGAGTAKGDIKLPQYACEHLKLHKNEVLRNWQRAVMGTVHGPTLLTDSPAQGCKAQLAEEHHLRQMSQAALAEREVQTSPNGSAKMPNWVSTVCQSTPQPQFTLCACSAEFCMSATA